MVIKDNNVSFFPDDFNIFALGVLAGRPHVMACSLFGLGKKRWVHRFNENLDASSLACISAGHSLVALGSKDGKIHLYECNHQFRSLRHTAVLSHHKSAIRSIIFADSHHIVSCSDDMTIGVVSIMSNGALHLTKLLHGHVSRVKAISVQNARILSGSDDRSVKLWSLKVKKIGDKSNSTSEKPLSTMTGHSGPVSGVQLSLPFALSSSGSSVRLWDVLQGTCLKLLQHDEDCPVTTMTWISTFKGVATVDSVGKLRCFDLFDLETTNHEIVVASSLLQIQPSASVVPPSSPSRRDSSPKIKVTSSEPISTQLADSVNCNVFKLESIPHHFSAFSLTNSPLPTITVHCLDYVL